MIKENKTFETVSCNLCGSKGYSIVYRACYENEKDKDIVQKFRASGDEMLIDQVVKCSKCGLIFINPRLKPELIIQGYSEGADETFVSQANAREVTFYNSLRAVEKFASHKGKVLDIGTAAGSFLFAAKKRGWSVYGCEPNKWMVLWGNKRYGLNIKTGTLFDQKYKSEFFDAITIWDVIEHTPDPSKVIKECNRILKEKGLLIINYPDIGSWLAKLLGRKWLFLISVHLFYFTPETIKKLLEKNGFKMILIKPHFQKLEFGYLLFRGAAYSKILSNICLFIARSLGITHKQVPYWLGQTFVIARKRRSLK